MPWMWLGGILLLIGAYITGRVDGNAIEVGKQAAIEAKTAVLQHKLEDTAAGQDEQSAAADQQSQTVIRETIREVPKIVDRPVYHNVCFDGDGVRLLRRAISSANGQLAPVVGPDGATGQDQRPADNHGPDDGKPANDGR